MEINQVEMEGYLKFILDNPRAVRKVKEDWGTPLRKLKILIYNTTLRGEFTEEEIEQIIKARKLVESFPKTWIQTPEYFISKEDYEGAISRSLRHRKPRRELLNHLPHSDLTVDFEEILNSAPQKISRGDFYSKYSVKRDFEDAKLLINFEKPVISYVSN